MALDTFANLRTAIGTWGTRTYSNDQAAEFILLAESKINRRLGPQYRRETTTTLNTDANGEVSLPSGFIGMRSITRDLAGSQPLIPVSWRALINLNAYEESGVPVNYAISGSTLKVAPICDDNFIAVYWASLTALSDANASNWLLAHSPDVYLFYCRAAQAAFEEEFDKAAVFEAQAEKGLDEVVGQGTVAQYAAAEMVLEGVTP